MIPSTMPEIRKAIQAELERRGWSVYRLIKEANAKKHRVNPDPVYKYLDGSRDCVTATLEPLLETLGLEVRRRR